MNGKFTKYLAYVFFFGLILIFILNGADEKLTWVPIVKLIAYVLAIGCGLVYVAIISYCIVENKKIEFIEDWLIKEFFDCVEEQRVDKDACVDSDLKIIYMEN